MNIKIFNEKLKNIELSKMVIFCKWSFKTIPLASTPSTNKNITFSN